MNQSDAKQGDRSNFDELFCQSDELDKFGETSEACTTFS